jgi:hypothetical protein
MICKDCGNEIVGKIKRGNRGNPIKYCIDCSRKRRNKSVRNSINRRYQIDNTYRKEVIRRNVEWADKHPERRWASTVIRNHRKHGKTIKFSAKELGEIAFKTKVCPICGIILRYGRKGKKGQQRDSPSMDNLYCKQILEILDIEIICAQCNSAKMKMNLREFLEYCKSILKYNGVYMK